MFVFDTAVRSMTTTLNLRLKTAVTSLVPVYKIRAAPGAPQCTLTHSSAQKKNTRLQANTNWSFFVLKHKNPTLFNFYDN